MTTKEKIVRKSIKEVTNNIEELKNVLFGNHLSKVIEFERKAIETAKKMDPREAHPYLKEKIKEKID